MKLLLTILAIALYLPHEAAAQVKYESLISIEGISDQLSGGFSEYVSFLYGLSIAIAALLAVIKIIVAGVKYMLSTLPGVKQDAKSEIVGALLGLLLILGAYVILNTINPRLINGGVQFQPLPEFDAKSQIFDRPDAIQVGGNTPTNNEVTVSSKDGVTTYNLSTLKGTPLADKIKQLNTECTQRGGTFKVASGGQTVTCTEKITTVGTGAAGQNNPEADTCSKTLSNDTIGGKDSYRIDVSSCSPQAQGVVLARFRVKCSPNSAFSTGGSIYYCAVPKN